MIKDSILRTRLLNRIREDSKNVAGINRIGACNILEVEYEMTLEQAVEETRELGEIIHQEKFGTRN